MFIISGARFTDSEFDEAMKKVREVNPVMADAIEGMAFYEDEGENA